MTERARKAARGRRATARETRIAHQRAAMEQEALDSLWGFVKVLWHILEPGVPFEPNWHHKAVCDTLERVMRGEVTDLVLCIPPGFMKSLLASVFLPAYWWIGEPEKRLLCLSAVGAVVTRDAEKMLALVQSPLYRRIVERYHRNLAVQEGRPWTERDRAKLWRIVRDGLQRTTNSAKGERLSFTMHANFTGPRADGYIVDDPYDVEEILFGSPMRIEERMTQIRKIVTQKLSTRLNDKRPAVRTSVDGTVESIRKLAHGWRIDVRPYGGAETVTYIAPRRRRVMVEKGQNVHVGEMLATGGYFKIIIMQRLHPDDVAGWTLENGTNVEHVILRQEYDPDNEYNHPDDPRTEAGELLQPGFFTPEVVAKAKSEEELGAEQFEAQHNQNPSRMSGNMFPAALFSDEIYYDEEPWQLVASMDEIRISVDCANKVNENTNYSSIGVWGKRGTQYFLLDIEHGKWEYDELEEAFEAVCRRWPTAYTKLIEDKANGITLCQRMRKKWDGIVPVEPTRAVDPKHPLSRGKGRSKHDRAAFTKIALKSRQIRLPRPEHVPKVDRLVLEHKRFGSGFKDDCVDMTSQVIEPWIVGDRANSQDKKRRWSRLAG